MALYCPLVVRLLLSNIADCHLFICSVALEMIGNHDNLPVMICCRHGKDRTGILSVLLNAVMGRDKEEIVQDYAKTKVRWCSPSRFSSAGRASGSQIFCEHEFKSRQPHLCNSMWGQDRLRADRQEVGKCSTRGESWGTNRNANKAEPTLALKPRGDVTRNPKQVPVAPKKDMCPPKTF